jgi:hypothetical protein
MLHITQFLLVFQDISRIQRKDGELLEIIQKLKRKEPCLLYFLRKESCTGRLSDKIPNIVMPVTEVQIIFIGFTVPQLQGIQRYFRQAVEFVFIPVEWDEQRRSNACTSV